MDAGKILNIIALVTLIEMMFYIGLSVSLAEIWGAVRNWRLVARGVLANYILFPMATIGLLLFFDAQPLVAVGFMILAVCPAGPYGPPFTVVAKGNVGAATGLMIILTGMSPFLSPVLLDALTPLVSETNSIEIDVAEIVITLLFGQLIPLLAGLATHQRLPQLAARMRAPARKGAKILNAVFLCLVVYFQFETFLSVRSIALLGILILIATGVAIGWLAGGPGGEERKAMALTTAIRNNGVAMVIATGSFSGTPTVMAVVICGLIGLLVALAAALRWGRLANA